MDRIFAVLGGDARQISLAAHLAQTGAQVRLFALPECCAMHGVCYCDDWRSAVYGAKAVLLPLPVSPDGVHVHAPLSPIKEPPEISELLDALPQDIFLAGGKFSPAVKALAEKKGKMLFDYCKSEAFQLANALPTAEGAVRILMDNTKRTISGLSVAITGFGRVARAVASLLCAMGAHVTVGARKEEALLQARVMGCDTVKLCGDSSVVELSCGKEAIFNTVPHWLFNGAVLKEMPQETVLIDLASSPGGVDAEAARRMGRAVIFALSLPGKYAPITAGEIIADTVLSKMREEGLL
jgi:dipicolinate synthase subunit A